MKKNELLLQLAAFADEDNIVVESRPGEYVEPVIYVTAVRARRSDELDTTFKSEYVADRAGTGTVVIGTHRGCTTL
ncbi:hypothetical protein GM658_05520 [Pseudoduganella eburnea]|uniref:Uncharacterized protein n=1 Tax=Massilia eburnea TaxID=1776165 RepID=A0A6L6QDC9_9BURK|nr:hypothetical protein [Massilia eburnea]MTW10054.1 hypothetical protein [Massilia eburnea]